MDLFERWRTGLDELDRQARRRTLTSPVGVDFSSNDYLGYGSGNCLSPRLPRSGLASRLLRGNDVRRELRYDRTPFAHRHNLGRDRQGREQYRHCGRIDERSGGGPERRQRQSDRVREPNQVAACTMALARINPGCLTL